MKRTIIYLSIILIWIIVFFSLTPIIVKFTSNKMQPISNSIKPTGDEVFYALDEFTISEKLTMDTYLTGWAFVETEEENQDKKVKLIFSSEKQSYEVETELRERKDIASVLINQNVPKQKVGIIAYFSPLNLKNGIYELYISVYENEKAYGIVDTNRTFIKNYRVFREIIAGEEQPIKDFIKAKPTKELKYYFDKIELEQDDYLINGWAFIENQNTVNNKIFLEIYPLNGTPKIYSTNKVERVDVSEYFQNENYNWSGFTAKIPKNAFIADKNQITIIINNEYKADNAYIFNPN